MKKTLLISTLVLLGLILSNMASANFGNGMMGWGNGYGMIGNGGFWLFGFAGLIFFALFSFIFSVIFWLVNKWLNKK